MDKREGKREKRKQHKAPHVPPETEQQLCKVGGERPRDRDRERQRETDTERDKHRETWLFCLFITELQKIFYIQNNNKTKSYKQFVWQETIKYKGLSDQIKQK